MSVSRDRFSVPWVIPWATGRWYGPTMFGTLSTSALSATAFFAVPVFVPNPAGVTATSIGVEVTVAGVAGALIRLSIYANYGARPGELILDAGTVAGDPGAVPAFQGATISQYLAQDWYWLALTSNAAPTVRSSVSGMHPQLFTRIDEASVANHAFGYTFTYSTSAFRVTAIGHPERWPDSGNPTHATYPRIMLGI